MWNLSKRTLVLRPMGGMRPSPLTPAALLSTTPSAAAQAVSVSPQVSTASSMKPHYGPADRAAVMKLKGRSLLRVDDYTPDELRAMLAFSHHAKRLYKANMLKTVKHKVLQGESIAMIFQKRSTRTRVSTETAATLLGAHPLFLGSEDVQLGVNESLRDTSVVLSRYNTLILARVFGHEVVTELSKYSSVPVINALSNSHHPLQSLADYMTLQEQFGTNLRGLTVSWVGDGNNVMNDVVLAGVMLGCKIRVATPVGHEPNAAVVKAARDYGGDVQIFTDPRVALEGADAIFTDTWVSMGQESMKAEKMKRFTGFKLTRQLIESSGANKGWKFLHCLPRHPEEVDDDVFYSKNSVVFDEAENRMYTVMAVMCSMVGVGDVV